MELISNNDLCLTPWFKSPLAAHWTICTGIADPWSPGLDLTSPSVEIAEIIKCLRYIPSVELRGGYRVDPDLLAKWPPGGRLRAG